MMGSIFAPDAMRSTATPYVAEPVETVVPHRASTREPRRTSGSLGDDVGTLNQEEALAKEQGSVPRVSAAATRKGGDRLRELPLVSPQFVSVSVKRRQADEGGRSGDIESPEEPLRFEAREPRRRASTETVIPTATARYVPLVNASQPRVAQIQPLVANAANAARAAKEEAARRPVPSQREAGEIHIHIGRIEVAASVSPAPQVVRPVTTTCKALSLDDYLKRGNGRGR